jgi:hypothetical protein
VGADARSQAFSTIIRILDDLERATGGSRPAGSSASPTVEDTGKPPPAGLAPNLLDRLRSAVLAVAVGGVTVSVDSPAGPARDVVAISQRGGQPGPSGNESGRAEAGGPKGDASPARLAVAESGAASAGGGRSDERAGSNPRPSVSPPTPASDAIPPAASAAGPAVRETTSTAAAAAPAEASAARALPEQIAAQTKLALDQGRSEVRLQLQPESLGRLDVRLSFDGGTVSVHLNAENPDVGSLLQANLTHLQSAFEHQGIRTDQLLVFVASGLAAGDSRDRSLDGRNHGRGSRSGAPRRLTGIAGVDEDVPAGLGSTGGYESGDGLVDTRI